MMPSSGGWGSILLGRELGGSAGTFSGQLGQTACDLHLGQVIDARHAEPRGVVGWKLVWLTSSKLSGEAVDLTFDGRGRLPGV